MLKEGLKCYSNQPNMVAKTFLRLERDFDKHVVYCQNEPLAQDYLGSSPDAKKYFQVSIPGSRAYPDCFPISFCHVECRTNAPDYCNCGQKSKAIEN